MQQAERNSVGHGAYGGVCEATQPRRLLLCDSLTACLRLTLPTFQTRVQRLGLHSSAVHALSPETRTRPVAKVSTTSEVIKWNHMYSTSGLLRAICSGPAGCSTPGFPAQQPGTPAARNKARSASVGTGLESPCRQGLSLVLWTCYAQ